MRCWPRLLTAALAALLVATSPSPARAQPAPEPSADVLIEQAFAAYRAHDYRAAAEKFLRAHIMQPDPNLLFNIGRCYEALGDRAAAIEKYEAFLASPEADREGRRRAQEALALLRSPPPPVAVAAPAAKTAAPHTADRGEPGGDGWRTASFVGLGLGAAAVAGGALFYALGARDHDQVTSAPGYGVTGDVVPLTETKAQALARSGHARKLGGGIAMGIGGAVLTASIIGVLVTPIPAGREGGLALGLAGGRGRGAVVLQGRF